MDPHKVTEDPRYPADGRVVRPTVDALRAFGFSEAEARTLVIVASATFCTLGDPLRVAYPCVVRAKAIDGWPYLPHEEAWLCREALRFWTETLARKGEAWFLRWKGARRLALVKSGTAPTLTDL